MRNLATDHMIEEMIQNRRMTMINSLLDEIGQAETGERVYSIFHKAKPESLTCNFCGQSLEYTDNPENFPFKYSPPRKCECEQAQKYWDTHSKRMAEIDRRCSELEQTERQKEEIRTLMKNSNLGRRFKGRTFETFITDSTSEKAYVKALGYAQEFEQIKAEGKGLFFIGTVGTGKTHLAAAIANYLISELVIPVKFGNISSLLSEVRDTYNAVSEKTEGEVIRVLSDVPLLIIDDLGKEKATEWTNNIIYTIVNNRYENYKPMVVTTNLSIKELDEQIGSATTSRLIEMCEGIKMDGMDYRKTKLM